MTAASKRPPSLASERSDLAHAPRLLPGDRALITGAASGIGREMALQLAAEGISLALIDIDAAGLAEVASRARKHGVQVEHRVLDVTDQEHLRAVVSELIESVGGVELCAPLAGLAVASEWLGLSDDQLDLVFGVNVLHAILTAQTCLSWARSNHRPCHVLLAGSDSVLHSTQTMGPYASSKAALTVFALSLASQVDNEPGLGVTLGLIFPTKSDLGRSSADYLDRSRVPQLGRTPARSVGQSSNDDIRPAVERLTRLNDYLATSGDDTEPVVARLIDGVRRGDPVVNTECRPSPRRRLAYILAPALRRLLPRTLAALTTPPRRR